MRNGCSFSSFLRSAIKLIARTIRLFNHALYQIRIKLAFGFVKRHYTSWMISILLVFPLRMRPNFVF